MSTNTVTPVQHPTKAGQLVQSRAGRIGITTGKPPDDIRIIAVMFIGGTEPTYQPITSLTVITEGHTS